MMMLAMRAIGLVVLCLVVLAIYGALTVDDR